MWTIHLLWIFIETEKIRTYNKQGATYVIGINVKKNIFYKIYKAKWCVGENFD